MPADSLLTAALDARVSPPDDAASERILDAALALSAAGGVRRLTMDAVASRAGVGRMTVYRRFGDRERLVEALAAREGRRCLAELDAAVDPADPVTEQIADGFATSMRLVREHPLLGRLARTEPESVLAALTEEGSSVFAMARGFLALRLRSAREEGQVAADLDPEHAAELLVRLCMSFVLIQESALPLSEDRELREVARRLIAPVVTAGGASSAGG